MHFSRIALAIFAATVAATPVAKRAVSGASDAISKREAPGVAKRQYPYSSGGYNPYPPNPTPGCDWISIADKAENQLELTFPGYDFTKSDVEDAFSWYTTISDVTAKIEDDIELKYPYVNFDKGTIWAVVSSVWCTESSYGSK